MSSQRELRVLVEVVIDGLDGARAAAAGGADRLELCSGLALGGLTPGPGTLAQVLEQGGLPVTAMVRPRAGDFLYSAAEFLAMRREVTAAVQAGAAGIVTGVLREDGTVDGERTAELVRLAGPLPVTFHRAFDLTRDPLGTLEELIGLGVARVLTSGQAATAPQGAACIAELVARARGRIAVMAGAGVRPDNVAALVARTGVGEVHLSASTATPSRMQLLRPGVAMGAAGSTGDRERAVTDQQVVAAVVAALAPPQL